MCVCVKPPSIIEGVFAGRPERGGERAFSAERYLVFPSLDLWESISICLLISGEYDRYPAFTSGGAAREDP